MHTRCTAFCNSVLPMSRIYNRTKKNIKIKNCIERNVKVHQKFFFNRSLMSQSEIVYSLYNFFNVVMAQLG